MAEINVRIRNIAEKDYQRLQEESIQQVGTSSIATFAKHLLFEQIHQKKKVSKQKTPSKKVRFTLHNRQQLEQLAEKEGMSVNHYIAMLLYNHTEHPKIMPFYQLQALRDSNYQLYQLGKNINQIAKHLNQGKNESLTSQQLTKLMDFLEEHTEKVMQVISTTPSL